MMDFRFNRLTALIFGFVGFVGVVGISVFSGTVRAADSVYDVDGDDSNDLDLYKEFGLVSTDLEETRFKATPKPRAAPRAPPRGSVAMSSEPVRAQWKTNTKNEDVRSTAETEDI